MRSGIIAKKIGMTRIFREDGKQVPVTVLKLEKLQVVAQRTFEKDGYFALKATLNNSSYTTATPSSNTTFGLSESADIILSDFGFNTTGGPLRFNHPVSVASDGARLIVVDRFNNRALIWNTIPSANTAPDIVLGQNNFYTEMEGTGLNNFNFPGQASITPDGKLLIADSNNNRILVWNSFPTSSGQPASYSCDIDSIT